MLVKTSFMLFYIHILKLA